MSSFNTNERRVPEGGRPDGGLRPERAMRKASLFLLVGYCCLGLQAQTSFVKYYDNVGTSRVNLNELSNGNLLTGIAGGSGTSVMDPLGNVLHTQCYAIDTFLFMQSVKKYSDNEFAFVGEYRKDTCSIGPPNLRGNPLIGHMDSLGNTYAVHYYSMNAPYCGFLCRDLEATSTNDVIAWGEESFFALRVGPSGVVQWAKWFGRRGGVGFIKELPGGDLLAGFNMDTAGVVVARLDATGNFLWCKSYIRPRGMVADCLVESEDSFVITGYTDSLASYSISPFPQDYHPKLFMLKLNGSGDVQWCKTYDGAPDYWYTPNRSRVVRAMDGNYAVLGKLGPRPFLMKTNQNGDTLWTRSAGRLNHYYDVSDLIACSDGGFMYDGQGYFLGMYIFKTNHLGYLPCENRWHQVIVSDLLPLDSSFTLTSVDGATMHPAFVSNAVYPSLEVDEPCESSTGQPPSIDGFRVRPNPNPGRFTVVFQDPLMAESYYSVYTAMGQLLYQRLLPVGKTVEEVDLSRYGAGTYLIKFTHKEGVCYERVLVE